jgi:hypothetical protein
MTIQQGGHEPFRDQTSNNFLNQIISLTLMIAVFSM